SHVSTSRVTSAFNRVFMITRTNGSLGSWILIDLLSRPNQVVKKVYCLIRGTDKQRLRLAFEQRKQDVTLLKDEKRLIILPQMDLSDKYLGQSIKMYKELQMEVTDIVHSVWKMNFDLLIEHFESDCIQGVYNLLKLAQETRIRFHFMSTFASTESSVVKEEPLRRRGESTLPQIGYGQSKYVAEHICMVAADSWGK
ncbi:unnamed protein product, partial [Didymodactylos carnosus]